MLEILSTIGGGLIQGVKGYFEVKQKKVEVQKAVEDNRARLALSEETNNSAWEMAQLTNSDAFLRRTCFVILMTPFVLAYFKPESVQKYFQTVLAVMPEWYITLVTTVIGAIWGISYARTAIPALLGPIVKIFKQK